MIPLTDWEASHIAEIAECFVHWVEAILEEDANDQHLNEQHLLHQYGVRLCRDNDGLWDRGCTATILENLTWWLRLQVSDDGMESEQPADNLRRLFGITIELTK